MDDRRTLYADRYVAKAVAAGLVSTCVKARGREDEMREREREEGRRERHSLVDEPRSFHGHMANPTATATYPPRRMLQREIERVREKE